MAHRRSLKAALLFLMVAAACAVPPRLDPATLRAVPAEERYRLRVGGRMVDVDHLRIETDSVRGRIVSATDSTGGSEVAVARDSTLELRRAYHGTPDLEFALLPPLLLVGLMLVFRAGYGSD